MRRAIFILLGLAVILPTAFLLYMRYGFMPGEGYPTWAAVRNYLVRDGEIVIIVPEGRQVVDAQCDSSRDVRTEGRTVTTKVGYTWCTISIDLEGEGKPETIHFSPQKLNNWSRMLFLPAMPNDPDSDFLKYENGIEKEHSDVTRESESEQGVGVQPATPPRVGD